MLLLTQTHENKEHPGRMVNELINLDAVEAIKETTAPHGLYALQAETTGGRVYTLATVKHKAGAVAILRDLEGALSRGEDVFRFTAYINAEAEYSARDKQSGAALDWTPPEGKTYHLGKRAEEQPAAINFYPDNPQPTPAERRAAAEAQAAAVRAAYHRAHRKNAEQAKARRDALDDAEAERRQTEYMDRQAAEVKRQLEEAMQAEGKPSDWADTITDAEEAEIKAYNAQTTAENLDIIRCSYPPDARGAIITQSGETITDPACWDEIYAEATPEGSLAITLEGGLDALGDTKNTIIGIYPEEQALRIYRDLRAQVENGGDRVKIVMPD